MKQIFTLFALTMLLISCNTSKMSTNNVVDKAMRAKQVDDEKYVDDKLNACQWLNLTEEQKNKAKKHFQEEIFELKKLENYDKQGIAKNVYKYETGFREMLTPDQLKVYKKLRGKYFNDVFFYSSYQTSNVHATVYDL